MNLKLNEGKSFAENLSKFQDLVNQLTTMKIVLDDKMEALLFLSSLPDIWETLVVSLSNSVLNGVPGLILVKDNLFNEEIKRKDLDKNDVKALIIDNREMGKSKDPKGRDNFRSQSKVRQNVKCFYCNKEDHIKKHCMTWKNKLKEEKNQKKLIKI